MTYYVQDELGKLTPLAENLADLYGKMDEFDLTWCNLCNAAVEPVAHLQAAGLIDHCEFCGNDLSTHPPRPIDPPADMFDDLHGVNVMLIYKPNHRSRKWRTSAVSRQYNAQAYEDARRLAREGEWFDWQYAPFWTHLF